MVQSNSPTSFGSHPSSPKGGSFTHVIKASEPVVSVILSFFINGIVPKPLTSLALLPITYGVAYASTLGNINMQTMAKVRYLASCSLVLYVSLSISISISISMSEVTLLPLCPLVH